MQGGDLVWYDSQSDFLGPVGNLQQVDYLYNERGWLQSINGGTSSPSGAPNDIFGQELYYYSHPNPPLDGVAQYNGNLYGQKISVAGSDTTFGYIYDESDRLLRSCRGTRISESFSYDANGNFLQRSRIGGDQEGTTVFAYHPGTNKLFYTCKLLPVTADTLEYDANGNVTGNTKKKAYLEYNNFDQLQLTTVRGEFGADTVWYGYNAAGERIYKAYKYHYRELCDITKRGEGKDEEGPGGGGHGSEWCIYTATVYTYYVLGSGKVLAELRSPHPDSANAKFIYAGGSRIAMRDATNKLHYYLSDHLGSTRVVLDSAGLVKDKYWYYTYGQTRSEQVNTNQAYRYTSKPLDKEGGLNIYYYGARYYDPELGRFYAIDPAADKYPGWSPYAYCADNPVRLIDPSGENAQEAIGGFFEGIWKAFLANAESVTNSGMNAADPAAAAQANMETGAGIAALVSDPVGVAGGILEQITSTWNSGDEGKGQVVGRVMGELGIAVALSKGVGALGKLGQASKVAGAAKVLGKGTHAVYQGFDAAGVVRYVGQTGRSAGIRFAEHARAVGTGRESLRFQVVKGAKGLTKTEARTWEQSLIEKYGMQKNGGQLLNKYNSIAP